VPGGITEVPVHEGYKYGDLTLQFEGASNERVTNGYGSLATLPVSNVHCKILTRPLVREGALHEEASTCQTSLLAVGRQFSTARKLICVQTWFG
jgi:hypothetical protein